MTEYVQFEKCPRCGSEVIAKLPKDWEGDLAIAIVGCGNPFHYTEKSLNDRPDDPKADAA